MPKPDEKPKTQGAGESQSGAYPNPHSGTDGDGESEGFLGHGGQSDIGYEGPDNPNATTRDEGSSGDE